MLDILLEAEYDIKIKMTNEQRRNLLEAFIRFYSTHVDSMGVVKSVQVLRDVLS